MFFAFAQCEGIWLESQAGVYWIYRELVDVQQKRANLIVTPPAQGEHGYPRDGQSLEKNTCYFPFLLL